MRQSAALAGARHGSHSIEYLIELFRAARRVPLEAEMQLVHEAARAAATAAATAGGEEEEGGQGGSGAWEEVDPATGAPSVEVHCSDKGLPRSIEKTLQENGGDFSRLLDVRRGSFVVKCPLTLTRLLRAVRRSARLVVVRAKCRLHPAFDARAESGGYRDILLNCRLAADGEDGHIFELQFHLRSFFESTSHHPRHPHHLPLRTPKLLSRAAPPPHHLTCSPLCVCSPFMN